MNTSEPKARSRIAIKPEAPPAPTPQSSSRTIKKNRGKQSSSFSFAAANTKFFQKLELPKALDPKYLHSIHFLIVSLVLYGVLFYIFTNVRPAAIANWLLYQSYPLVIVLFFLATFFLTRFVFLKKHLAWSISFWLTLLLFLKLQSFALSFQVIFLSALVLVVPALIWPIVFKR